ncbi:SusD/RagB family nutrient-binding outer membrane lipoprotein [Hufsiella ginkgonis]|uniref:SusD/RagB family nutrient-binding outer membrane lipoprotein n=1 Tax=Hufsiella ginkgonis TaxID=2695274 RepID=A0A7K1XZS1_9SPHI|nr:SusD/RagB family nutrient-binding outer membrane lipoprotein [Hufsiella ginkgonis]MXV16473.1 SusD/RagB family nutrient-binding outer membrane lipoprotein [Hufsiella ginkgonis]
MRNIKIKLTCIALLVGSTMPACKDFVEVNTDPIGTPTTTPAQLLAPSLVNLVSANMLRGRTFNNELMQVTVNISDADGQINRYDIRRPQADYTWNALFTELTNVRDIYTLASKPEYANGSYKGISRILEAYAVSVLTDTYGDIPYTEANKGRDGIVEPKFDRQKDIYLDLYKNLEEANTLLTTGTAINATTDRLFNGNITKWRKLGNSLYLRLLLRLSGKAEVSATAISKLKEIIGDPAKYPVMTSNDDTARLPWTESLTSTALYSSPYTSIRALDFRSAVSKFFIDHLRDWNHPVVNMTYGKNGTNRWGISTVSGSYVGVPAGYTPGSLSTGQSSLYAVDNVPGANTANVGNTLQNDAYTGIIMNVAEVDFILAEAAINGWISGPVATYYNKGVLDMIQYWIPSYPVTSLAAYMTAADINWSDAQPLADKMEMLHLQKYYALFLVDSEQWAEYRRTGHPVLPVNLPGTTFANGGVMPARNYYPVIVQTANRDSYNAAVAIQGADAINTQIWSYKKP